MRVLITGAAGFLGSHLCDRFIADGHEVIAMDSFITGTPDNLAHLMGEPRFRFVQHDVTEFVYVEGPLDGMLHFRSEERRVGKECRSRGSPNHEKKKK